MTWMKVTISAAEAEAGGYDRIVESFDAAFMAAHAPEDAALFTNSVKERDYVFYFSPAAADIFSASLQALGAESCAPPPAKGTIFTLGHDTARHMLI